MTRNLPNPEFCRTSAIPGTHLSDCLVDAPSSCQYALSFGHGYLCKNPDHKSFNTPKGWSFGDQHALKLAAQVMVHIQTSGAPEFAAWQVGLMQDIDRCYCELKRPRSFNFWLADSMADAKENADFLAGKKGLQLLDQLHLDPQGKTYLYIVHRSE